MSSSLNAFLTLSKTKSLQKLFHLIASHYSWYFKRETTIKMEKLIFKLSKDFHICFFFICHYFWEEKKFINLGLEGGGEGGSEGGLPRYLLQKDNFCWEFATQNTFRHTQKHVPTLMESCFDIYGIMFWHLWNHALTFLELCSDINGIMFWH